MGDMLYNKVHDLFVKNYDTTAAKWMWYHLSSSSSASGDMNVSYPLYGYYTRITQGFKYLKRECDAKMQEHEKNYRLDTLAVHAGYDPSAGEHSMVPPIYQSNAYAFETAEQAKSLFELSAAGNIYTRITNPTVAVLEQRVNAMEGGVGAVAMSSGHAAIFNTVLNLAGAGDEIVSSRCIYGGAVNLLGVTLQSLGIRTRFVDPDDFAAWEGAISDKTKALFVEVVGNPNANVADLERLAELAHRHGIPLVVDSTVTTPFLIKPFEHGADIIIHSATKYLGGHGNAMAGVVVDSGKFAWAGNGRFPQYNTPDVSYHGLSFGEDCGDAGFSSRLRALLLRDVGACLSPFNAFLILTGMETLTLRMRKHCDNALTVARFLQGHTGVERVNYPGLQASAYHALAQRYLPEGAGACYSFVLKGGRKAGVKFLDSLRLFRNAANLGDARSMVSHPATTTHSQLSDEQLLAAGITAGTVRISVGIENAEDLTADLEQALRVIQ